MRTVNELIALGKVPSNTVAASESSKYVDGWPIFVDLISQVKFDYENLPADRFKTLKNNPEYAAALEKLFAPTPAEGEIPVAVAASPEAAIVEPPTPAPTAPVVPESSVESAVSVDELPVVPAGEEEGTVIEYPFGTIQKVKGGWEARVDNKDGSGIQVYKGKTKDELIGKLMQAQAYASQKIRQQEGEKQRLLLDEPADPAPVRKVLQPRQLTAEEQFDYAEAMSSADPQRMHKAQEKRDAIRNGGTPEEISERLREAEDKLAVEAYKATAKAFMKQNDDVVFTRELGDKIDEVLNENAWGYTVRNLNKVLATLKANNEVTMKISTPTEEAELPVPTSAQVTPAPAASVEPTRVPPATTPKAAERLRPGSASTGLSPRQASVRQGQQPVAPVGLTAEEYNRMSVSETRHKYKTDAGFAKAVDKLIAEGKI